MKSRICLILLFCTAIQILGANYDLESTRMPYTSQGEGPQYFLDHASYQGTDGETYVEFYFQVGYRALQFIKENEQFKAGYTFHLSIMDNKGETVEEHHSDDAFYVSTFEETLSRTTARVALMAFSLKPGSYQIRSSLQDMETQKSAVIAERINVQQFHKKALQVSEIQFSQKISPSEDGEPYVKNNRYIEPNAVRVFSHDLGDIYMYFEIYNLDISSEDLKGTYTVEFFIQDVNGKAIGTIKRRHVKPATTSANSIKFGVDYFNGGEYFISLKIRDDETGQIAQSRSKFRVLDSMLNLSKGQDPGEWYK